MEGRTSKRGNNFDGENPFLFLITLIPITTQTSQYRLISATSHYSQYISMKQNRPKLLSPKHYPTFFLISSLESISIFKTKQKTSLMKPDTFESLTIFSATTIPQPLSTDAFKYKNSENGLCLQKFEMK